MPFNKKNFMSIIVVNFLKSFDYLVLAGCYKNPRFLPGSRTLVFGSIIDIQRMI